MNFWKIIFATVVIFATGVITGGLLVGVSYRMAGHAPRFQPWQPPVREVVNPGAPGLQPVFEKRRLDFILSVHRELNLSREQRDRIEKILRDGQERTREIMEKVSPELRKETKEVREKIQEVLTPEQQKRFEKLMKQRQLRGPETPPQDPMRGPRDQRFPKPPRNAPPPNDEPMSPPPESPPPGGASAPPSGNAY